MLSVVISTFNRHPAIFEAVIHSISEQEKAQETELVIVNDGGTVGTPGQFLENYKHKFAKTKYIYNKSPGMSGNALGFNIGIKQSTGEHIVIAGSDVLWGRDILKNIIDSFSKSQNYKEVVGPYVYGMTPVGTDKILKIPQQIRLSILPNGLNLPIKHEVVTDDVICTYSHPTRIDEFCELPIYFLSAYSRQLLYEVGGINEDFNEPGIQAGYEDTEFNKRLFLYGCKAVWIEGKAFHLFHAHNTEGYVHYSQSKGIEINKAMYDSQTDPIANKNREWGMIRV